MNYYIQGSPARAEGIKAAFGKFVSTQEMAEYDFSQEEYLFYTGQEERGTFVYAARNDSAIADIIKTHPDYKELELPVQPKFNVGDKIEATIYGIKRRVTIREIDKTNLCYFGTLEECIGFSEQDQWHLVPKPHYDISNFKPFDKVLVRDEKSGKWVATFYSHYMSGENYHPYNFVTIGTDDVWCQCIPFDGNEHLLGTTDMCDEQYINW